MLGACGDGLASADYWADVGGLSGRGLWFVGGNCGWNIVLSQKCCTFARRKRGAGSRWRRKALDVLRGLTVAGIWQVSVV